jgi:hypothetical protein
MAEKSFAKTFVYPEAKPEPDGIWQMPEQEGGGLAVLKDLLKEAPTGTTHDRYWYLEDPETRIPEEWRGKTIFFREYSYGMACCIYWDGTWCPGLYWRESVVGSACYVVVPAATV